MSKLHSLTGARKLRLLSGLWAASEGLVYELDPAIHVIDRFDIPKGWRKVRLWDFGYTNPTAVIWAAFDNDGRVFIYRQWYMTQMLVSDHAKRVTQLSEGENYEATIADPEDAEGRATLHKAGIHTIPAKKDIQIGIEALRLRLRKAGDGKPRFFILRDSLVEQDPLLLESKLPTCLEEEFDCYIYPPGKSGKSADEVPVDANNHALDLCRYLSVYRQPTKVNASVFTLPAGHVYQPPARNVNNFTGLKNPPKTFPV